MGWAYWIDLEAPGSFQIGKHLNDLFRHRGLCWKVGSTCSETILICKLRNSHDNSVGLNIRVRSAGYWTDIFRLRSYSLLETTLFHLGTIFTLVAFYNICLNCIFESLMSKLRLIYKNVPVAIRSIEINLISGPQDDDRLPLKPSRKSHGESKDQDHQLSIFKEMPIVKKQLKHTKSSIWLTNFIFILEKDCWAEGFYSKFNLRLSYLMKEWNLFFYQPLCLFTNDTKREGQRSRPLKKKGWETLKKGNKRGETLPSPHPGAYVPIIGNKIILGG